MKNLIFTLMFLLFFSSCVNEKKIEVSRINSKKFLSNYEFGLIDDIAFVNNKLIILDSEHHLSDNYLFLIDIEKEVIIDSTLRKGNGPLEMISPRSINNVVLDKNKLSVFDVSNGRLYIYEIGNDLRYKKYYRITRDLPLFIALRNKNEIFALTANSINDKRVSVYDSLSYPKYYLGDLLPVDKDNIPNPMRHQSADGKMKICPNNKKIVVVSRYSDYIDIIDIETKKTNRIEGPEKFLPIYNVVNTPQYNILELDVNETKLGYVCVELTNEHIYVLFSGKKFLSFPSGNQIHVYNYSGELVKKIELDREIQGFAFDETNNIIYGISNEPKPAILKFEYKINE